MKRNSDVVISCRESMSIQNGLHLTSDLGFFVIFQGSNDTYGAEMSDYILFTPLEIKSYTGISAKHTFCPGVQCKQNSRLNHHNFEDKIQDT